MERTRVGETTVRTTGSRPALDRGAWDRIISGAGLVVGIALIVLGAAAVYGGLFGRENVQDRLEPQKVFFPPLDAMAPEERVIVGDFAGEQVDTGSEAEAYSRYIGIHLAEVNEGKTYAETSAEARAEGIEPDAAAELQGRADTLFKGETLRAILLNAYGWWTVATIALYTGIALGIAGLILVALAILGFRHARAVSASTA
jgi:hypothetical protein